MGKKKKRRIPVKTGRVVHHFWLNIWNGTEGQLDNAVQELKKQRKFAETVRDGLRLILDLRAGSLVVLFELFPHLQERLTAQPVSAISQPPPAPNTTELAKEIATQIILQGGADKILMQSTGQGSKQIGGFKPLPLPTFDEDETEAETQPTIAVTKNVSINAIDNFISAMTSLR